jgi:hypothetical protein
MEQEEEEESKLVNLDPCKQTIRDPQVFMIQHFEQGFTVNLAMDGNESDSRTFCPPTENNRLTNPLGFNYDSRISGSIAGMLEACNLMNIHTLQHGEAPPTHKQGSQLIDFMFISRRLVPHVNACGILLVFDAIFVSDHRPLYVNFELETLFGHPSFGTERAALRDLQLDNPRLFNAYEDALCRELEKHNVEFKVIALFHISEETWSNQSQGELNKIDRDIERTTPPIEVNA